MLNGALAQRRMIPRGASRLEATANAMVAARFRRLADLLEIEGANPFRVRAYRRAASTVETLQQNVADQDLPALDALPGMGTDLAAKVREICRTTRLGLLEATEARVPPFLVELSGLPGLGPTRIRRLHAELGIGSAADLRAAVAASALRNRPGFGLAQERRLAAALAMKPPRRWPLAEVAPQAEDLVAALRLLPGVEAAAVAGSIRRGRPDVGDIDLVPAARPTAAVASAFAALPQVAEVLACGPTRATVRLLSGLQADLLVVGPESYGAAVMANPPGTPTSAPRRSWRSSPSEAVFPPTRGTSFIPTASKGAM